jgi:hypothetical protein
MGQVTDETRVAEQLILRQRAQLHLVSRLGARLFQVIASSGVAHSPGLVVAVVLWACVDVALALVLQRTSRPLLRGRVALDSLDAAFWTLWVPGGVPYTGFALASCFSIAETGFRYRLVVGLAAGCSVNAAVTIARLAAGHELHLADSTLFTLAPVIFGWALRRYVDFQARDAAAEARVIAEARLAAIEFETRSIIQIGRGGGVIDSVQRAWWFLSLDGDTSAAERRDKAQRHKRSVAEEVRNHAGYLRDLLDEYAAAGRASEPDTRRHSWYQVTVNDGLTVLTRDQAEALWTSLAKHPTLGTVPVRVVSRSLADGSFSLIVDGIPIAVPPARARKRLFLSPAGFIFGGAMMLTQWDPSYTAAPWYLCLVAAALLLAVAWRIQQRLAFIGTSYLGVVNVLSVLPVLLAAGLGLSGRQGTLADGRVLIPVLGGVSGWAFIMGTVQSFITMRQAVLNLGAVAAAVAFAVATYPPGHPTVLTFVADLIFPSVAFAGTRRLTLDTLYVTDAVQLAVLNDLPRRSEERAALVVRGELEHLRAEVDLLARAVVIAPAGEWGEAAAEAAHEAVLHLADYDTHTAAEVRRIFREVSTGAPES